MTEAAAPLEPLAVNLDQLATAAGFFRDSACRLAKAKAAADVASGELAEAQDAHARAQQGLADAITALHTAGADLRA